MPLAVVDGVNTASPQLYYVHTDHINRPIRMSTTAKVMVWQAEWDPWGGVQSLTGSLAQNLRFPGQWFQIETGLHYNWHRHYDPSIGRYTQPDPLGFVDGPSVYAYAKSSPQDNVDPDGRQSKDWNDFERWAFCTLLNAATTMYCKPFNYLETTRCFIWDSCATIHDKIRKRQKCIQYQSMLTRICYPNSPSHDERYQQESDGIAECLRIAASKQCQCTPF